MRHLAVYLLLVLGGNENPTADEVSHALSAAGLESDAARVDQLIAELGGKNIKELMDAGRAKLATVSVGGGGGGGSSGGSGGDDAVEEVVEEEEEEAEEIDFGGDGMDMFGGGGDY